MSGFKALNIESDDESDIEIDDTKELQIEDALKLYQNALKLHAEGPKSFERAAEAYEELFRSDIFKYPESQSELRRIELYGPTVDDDDIWQDVAQTGSLVPAAGGVETGPSTLQETLHLSHKNYAQFKLEYLTSRLQEFQLTLNQILSDATAALDHFVTALDKDDSDLDLWRRTASVGELLESKRIARFCLEAVLEGDDEGLESVLALPGLQEGLAGEQLRNLVAGLEDQLSMFQNPLPPGKRKVLSNMLKQRLRTYPEIAEREQTLRQQEEPQSSVQLSKTVLKAPTTWADLGDALIRQPNAQNHKTASAQTSSALAFDLSSIASPEVKALDAEKSADSAPAPEHARPINHSGQQPPQQSKEGSSEAPAPTAPTDDTIQTANQPSTEEDTAQPTSPTMTLVTRKRSGDTAGLNNDADEGRAKVKRTRTRESTTVEDSRQALIDANIKWEQEQQINEIQAADDWMFETVGNLFERIGVVGFEAAREVRSAIRSPPREDGGATNGVMDGREQLKLARADLQAWLANYSDQLAQFLTTGSEGMEAGHGAGSSRLGNVSTSGSISRMGTKPPAMPDDGVLEFLRAVNDKWMLTQDVAWKWICALLRPDPGSDSNTYRQYLWSDQLKTAVVRTLVNFDESLHETAKNEFDIKDGAKDSLTSDEDFAVMVETIFELHLDVYCLIKEPNSGVDDDTIYAQRDRLHRWSALAREAMHLRARASSEPDMADELNLRFLWATTFHIAASNDVTQDHVLQLMNDLREMFAAAAEPAIQLQNNAIIPELSIAALDQEISKLTTRDFFLKVTTKDQSDPVALIESLEPLLTALDQDLALSGEEEEVSRPAPMSTELIRFLQSSDTSVRLLLWQKLRNAYENIDYIPMVVSCYLKMIKMLLNDMKSALSPAMQQHNRQVLILKTLRQIHEMTRKIFHLVHDSRGKTTLECVDENGLKSAISSFGEILQLLQVFNVFEDPIRLEHTQPPTLTSGQPVLSFKTVRNLVHEMQIHVWVILYHFLLDSIFQLHDMFPNPAEDKFDFLRTVHRNFGLRGICGGANKVFIRMLKEQFFQMTHIEGYDSEQAQVLYDLYGLNCFLNPSHELMEHNCTHDAFVEKSVALQAVDLLLQQAAKLPVKDLAKHTIKDTIDRVHGLAPRKKPTEAIMRNRETYRSFLRSPINPIDLYNCLIGEGNQLAVVFIPKDDALLASKGWYFLMGHIALAKFRSQKRTAPTPTEDVDIAIAFFMQDLEYSMENWETWFRLAQSYDTKIEENAVWSAEKLNNSISELVQLQRAAIHCYTMATALAYSSAEISDETSEKMTEMFADFAMRLYASSRPPFGMLPFQLDDTEKFFSLSTGMGKGKPFQPLSEFTAWKLARTFFQKAIRGRPQSWMLQFMLGKCQWKMHQVPLTARNSTSRPTSKQVVRAFVKAIELIPDEKKKDSREKREPVLEPHYKLVSVVHKLLTRGDISLEDAKEALENTPYGNNGKFPEEMDEWVPYMLRVLKGLRASDKSNWHHRMVNRAARIVYKDSDSRSDGPGQNLGALGAKHELTQQMFTKTMVLQVWRPDSERAGRHFVYTASYTRFFVAILEQLQDRPNLEMLARRVRRRPHDVFEHSQVWQEICFAYLRILRTHAQLAEGLETSTFSPVFHDDFLARKEPLERWMQAQDTGVYAQLDCLREVQELKKINQSLMKPGPIDDLIGDAYAALYNRFAEPLYREELHLKQEEEARNPPPPPPAASPPRNPMMSLTHLMNTDGSSEATPAAPPPAAAAPPADQAPVRRKIGVGRREIRTTAEACFQKAPTTSTAASSGKTGPSYPRVQVMIDSARDLADVASAETSAPGSIHDSADDESELSELEEEGDEESGSPAGDAKPRPIFPGLASNLESRVGSEGVEGAVEDGEDEDDGGENVDGDVDGDGDGDGDVTMGFRGINASGPTPGAQAHGPGPDQVEGGGGDDKMEE